MELRGSMYLFWPLVSLTERCLFVWQKHSETSQTLWNATKTQTLLVLQNFCQLHHLFCSAGVGSVNNTFGIPGVKENTFAFKTIDDASKLRRRVSECFERAALPQTPDEVLYLESIPVVLYMSFMCACQFSVDANCMAQGS